VPASIVSPFGEKYVFCKILEGMPKTIVSLIDSIVK